MITKKITPKELTVKFLQEIGNVQEAINYARELQDQKNLNKPKKPIINAHNATSLELREYADKLEAYEKSLEEYKTNEKAWREVIYHVEQILVEFIKEESGLNNIPEQYRNKVWDKAYEDEHSSGYYAVYQRLESLLEIFS